MDREHALSELYKIVMRLKPDISQAAAWYTVCQMLAVIMHIMGVDEA